MVGHPDRFSLRDWASPAYIRQRAPLPATATSVTTVEGRSALFVLDFPVGVADQPFARAALAAAIHAVSKARCAGLDVVYSRMSFQPGYADVPSWSPVFHQIAEHKLIAPGTRRIVDALTPGPGDIEIEKDRFSPFAGSNLDSVVRSRRITHFVVGGLSTSGVVLATFGYAENMDVPITILKDACADTDDVVHSVLVERHFPRSATVTTVEDWQPAAAAPAHYWC